MGFKVISNEENESIIFDEEGLLKAENYWSEERISKAIPIKVVLPHPNPDLKFDEVELSTVAEADVNNPPFNAGGKLFFSMGGDDYVGSAEYCENGNMILTAAHCIRDKDTGEWSENIVFKRAYKNSSCKQVVPIKAVALKSYWYKQKEYRWDYAFGISDTTSEVTALSSEINVSSGNSTAFGYPSNYHSGIKMQCVTAPVDLNPYDSKILRMKGNTMGGGCSGGAWVKDNSGVVISLNSFSYKGDDTSEYGPLLTEDYNNLCEYAKTLI